MPVMPRRLQNNVITDRRDLAVGATNHTEQTRLLLPVQLLISKTERAAVSPENHQTYDETEVTNTIDNKCLIGGNVRRLPLGIEANQQEARNPDKFPEHKHLKDVACQNNAQHRKAEKRQKRKETMKSTRTMNVMTICCVS